MITLANISKQYGRQVLFVETSFQLNPGEKVGLVGPNGAGKTTVFRLITGEESPDEGAITIPKRTTIGYFRQDVSEMSGRSVLDEAIAGSGRLGELHHELEALQHALADPDRADEMATILERFGEVQDDYQHAGGYDLEARAREILQGLGFADDQIDGDVGALSGGWKMRVGMARVLIGRPDVLLMDEPTNHLDIESILWLEAFIKNYPGAVLLTCHDKDFMNRVVSRIVDIDQGEFVAYTGDYDFFVRQRAISLANREAAVRAATGHARQGTPLRRALRRPRGQGRAGAEPRQEARQDRAGGAAEGAQGGRVPLPPAHLARATTSSSSRASPRPTARASSTTASTSRSAAPSAGASWAATAPARPRC